MARDKGVTARRPRAEPGAGAAEAGRRSQPDNQDRAAPRGTRRPILRQAQDRLDEQGSRPRHRSEGPGRPTSAPRGVGRFRPARPPVVSVVVEPLIAAPTCAGFPEAEGLRLGPAAILAQLARLGEVEGHAAPAADLCRPDLGDGGVAAVTAAVREAAACAAAAGRAPVVVGGDHTVALGGIAGVREGVARREGRPVPLFVLWLDAHADVNTDETSPTGHLHGMALAGVLGAGPLALAEPLPAEQVALAGVRALDPGELAFLQARPELAMWDVQALRGRGWMGPAAALLRRVAAAGGRLYVSVDLDVLDPAVAPGVAVPERHGARPAPVLALLRRLRGSGLLAGADVVELYPPADADDRTARLAARALEALGAVAARRRARRPRPRAA